MKRTTAFWLTIGIVPVAWAEPSVETEMKEDVILRSLVDELERGRVGLKLEGLAVPYFLEYALGDAAGASASAKLGAVVSKNSGRSRRLRADVRVGSYELDNTNYGGGGFGGFGGGFGDADIPIEDDYNAIRQAIWWSTDREYKDVVETFEQKKADMESKIIEDKPPDFSHEAPAVHFDTRRPTTVDADGVEQLAVALSAIFREFPDVQDSSVSAQSTAGNKYLINSEGTRIRTADGNCAVRVSATVQAEDGMKLTGSLSASARRWEELPPQEELATACRELATQLLAVKNAPVLEAYTGPVLFDAEAAAAVFSQRFAGQFAGGQRPVGSRASVDDFAKKLNKRILPRFINVVDDPTQERVNDEPVMAHYRYDDQGVAARPVTLVEEGRLKAQVMSRNPSKEFASSTGHGRGAFGPAAAVGCLMVSAEPAADAEALKQELREACEDEGLEYGIRVATLGSVGGGGGGFGFPGGGGGGASGTPLVMYKVFPGGREELVRGAEIARIDLKAFKRMLAAGNTPFVLNTGGTRGQTIVCPALLFEELDLVKIDRDFDKPPILPAPLARSDKR